MADDIFAGPPPGKEDIFSGPPPKSASNYQPAQNWREALVRALPGGGGLAEKYLGHVAGETVKGVTGLVKGFGDIYEAGKAGQIPSTKEMIPEAMGMAAIGMGGAPRTGLAADVRPPGLLRQPPRAPAPPAVTPESALQDITTKVERGAGPVAEPAGEVIAEVGKGKSLADEIHARAHETAKAESEAQRKIVQEQGKALTEAVRGGKGEVGTPREAGELVGQGVRGAAQQARADVAAKYKSAFEKEGDFADEVLSGVGQKIEKQIVSGPDPAVLYQGVTPVADRAIQLLNNIEGKSLREVETSRKALNRLYGTTAGPASKEDRRAVRMIIDRFDDHIENAIGEGLFSGDASVLKELKDARGASASYKRTFGPQGAGDDVGLAMRKIVERKATPEEIANMVIGSKNLNAGLPVRIADRLEKTLGKDSEGFNGIRQAVLQRSIHDPEELVNLANSSLGRRMFSTEERAAMHAQAQGMKELEAIIQELPAMKDAAHVRTAYERLFSSKGIGGTQGTVFQRIVDGIATPEEVSSAIFGAIGSKSTGNVVRMIKAIAKITGEEGPAIDAIRQGAWKSISEKVTESPEEAVKALNEFLKGRGKAIAETLYEPAELADMRKFHNALAASKTNDKAIGLVQKYATKILATIGFVSTHGVSGVLSGYGAGKLVEAHLRRSASKKFSKAFSPPAQNPAPTAGRSRIRIPAPVPQQKQYGGTDD